MVLEQLLTGSDADNRRQLHTIQIAPVKSLYTRFRTKPIYDWLTQHGLDSTCILFAAAAITTGTTATAITAENNMNNTTSEYEQSVSKVAMQLLHQFIISQNNADQKKIEVYTVGSSEYKSQKEVLGRWF